MVAAQALIQRAKSLSWQVYKRRPWRLVLAPLFPSILLVRFFFSRRIRLRTSRPLKRILIVHFGALGDILMSTPALWMLRKQNPKAQLHAIVANHSVAEALRKIPLIDTWDYLEQFPGAHVQSSWDRERSELQAGWKAGEFWL